MVELRHPQGPRDAALRSTEGGQPEIGQSDLEVPEVVLAQRHVIPEVHRAVPVARVYERHRRPCDARADSISC